MHKSLMFYVPFQIRVNQNLKEFGNTISLLKQQHYFYCAKCIEYVLPSANHDVICRASLGLAENMLWPVYSQTSLV